MTRGSTARPADHPSPVSVGSVRSGGRALVAFFVLAYALSWAWVIPLGMSHLVVDRGQGWPTHYPALFGPAVAAVLVVAGTTGRQGIAQLLQRIGLWRVGWRWWLVAFSPAVFLAIALHLPQFFVIATYRALGVADYVGFVIGLSCGAIVLTWLYNRSGGSILLVAVWHGVYNVASGTQAATGVVAAVVSTLIMAQALLLVGLDLRARHKGQPSPLSATQLIP